MAASRIIGSDPSARKLPAPPPAIVALLAASGKVRRPTQWPVISNPDKPPPSPERIDADASVLGEAIRIVVRTWRARMPGLLEKMPHDVLSERNRPPVFPVAQYVARGIVHGAELADQFPIGGPER